MTGDGGPPAPDLGTAERPAAGPRTRPRCTAEKPLDMQAVDRRVRP